MSLEQTTAHRVLVVGEDHPTDRLMQALGGDDVLRVIEIRAIPDIDVAIRMASVERPARRIKADWRRSVKGKM